MLHSQSPSPSVAKWWAEVIPTAQPATLEDLLNTPDDGSKYELVEGVLLRMPPPQRQHGYIQINIGAILRAYRKSTGIQGSVRAECGYLLKVTDEAPQVFSPDVSFTTHNESELAEDTYEKIAPDLVVEIASPSQYRPEMVEKVRLYLAAGVQLVWLVWPNPELVEVWQADETTQTRARNHETLPSVVFTSDATLAGFAVLPAFTCPVADFFEE